MTAQKDYVMHREVPNPFCVNDVYGKVSESANCLSSLSCLLFEIRERN